MSSFRYQFQNIRTGLLTALVSALLCACGGGGSNSGSPSPPGAPPMVERNLAPSSADPLADAGSAPHFVVNPSPNVAPKGNLFVFLSGTGGVPNQYKLIVRAGATRGYHAIGLAYPDPQAVGTICSNSSDPDCFWNVRREVVTGLNVSADISISPANSIVTRLTKAINYLMANSPAEGWGVFLLADGTLDWSRIVIGGHSQGGGHAGVMSKLYSMNRACYFASPADWVNGPAAWMSRANVTPASRQFGVVHVDDPLVPLSQLTAIWPTLGMAGPITSVDGNSAPYGNSHQLTTQAAPVNVQGILFPLHSVTVLDAVTPLQPNGTPLFDPVWAYACFS